MWFDIIFLFMVYFFWCGRRRYCVFGRGRARRRAAAGTLEVIFLVNVDGLIFRIDSVEVAAGDIFNVAKRHVDILLKRDALALSAVGVILPVFNGVVGGVDVDAVEELVEGEVVDVVFRMLYNKCVAFNVVVAAALRVYIAVFVLVLVLNDEALTRFARNVIVVVEEHDVRVVGRDELNGAEGLVVKGEVRVLVDVSPLNEVVVVLVEGEGIHCGEREQVL